MLGGAQTVRLRQLLWEEWVKHFAFSTALILHAFMAPVTTTAQESIGDSAVTYDAYVRGIRFVEITAVGPRGEQDHVTIRRRDMRRNSWSAPVRVSMDAEELQLPSLGHVGSLLEDTRVDWSAHTAVSWPNAGGIYQSWLQLTAEIDGVQVTATRWAVRDASSPVDLIIGNDDQFVAAVHPPTDVVLVKRGYEAFTTVADWRRGDVSPPDHGFRELPDVTFRARDDARLATLVYVPTGPQANGPFPTILIRTPYGITGLMDTYFSYAVRGYAVVLQATRGRTYWDPENLSEGVWTPMVDEAADGADVLEWITRQSWSDGQVCMEGASYLGYTQWAASMAGNPALKCLIPESSMGTAFSDQPYRGGGFVEGLAYYVFWMLDKPILEGRTWSDILHHRPLNDIDRFATGEDIPQWNAFFEHWENDDYWSRQDWYSAPVPRNFSTLQISGWFDDDLTGTQSNWDLMQRSSAEPQRLILGPWKHGYNRDRSLNGFNFGPAAIRDDVWLLKQRWYDHFLRNVENGVEDEAVEYFLLGANEWRSAEAWPPPEATRRSLYLRSDGNAARLTNRGSLDLTPPSTTDTPDQYEYDPANPPANWMSFDLMESWADVQRFPYDFKDIEARPDVAIFTSDPLERDLTVAGTVEVELFASTDALDTDWWVHLSDVYPDNTSVRLTTGMLRARFRNLEDPIHQVDGSNFKEEKLLSGDLEDVVRYHFTIPATANLFRAGHRIRIAVMNSMDNYNFPNSNTGGDEGTVTDVVVGTMRIHHGSDHPSRVTLQVLPGG
jgi:putative CocE/NonD family hydrolase